MKAVENSFFSPPPSLISIYAFFMLVIFTVMNVCKTIRFGKLVCRFCLSSTIIPKLLSHPHECYSQQSP